MPAGAIIRNAKLLRQSETLRHIGILFSGKAAVQLIALVSQPILARLYSPAQFGEFAFLNSVLAILVIAASGRYETGILLTKKPLHAKRLFQLGQWILVTFTSLLYILLLFIPASLQQAFTGERFSSLYLWLLPLLVFCTGYWGLVQNWLMRFQEYSKVSTTLLIQRLLIFAGALMAAVFPFPGNGLVYGLLLGCFSILVMSYKLQREPLLFPFKAIKVYAHHFRELPLYSAPTLFVTLSIHHLPILAISIFFDNHLAGAFSMAYALLMVPLSVLSMSVGQVFYARLAQSPTDRRRSIIQKTSFLYTLILIPISLIAFFFGEAIITFLLGDEWQQTGEILPWLAPIIFAQGLGGSFLTALNACRKQAFSLKLQILKFILWLGAIAGGIIFHDVIIALQLMSISSFIHLFLITYVLRVQRLL